VDSLKYKEKKRMKRRFREEQIIGILKLQESGMKTADICREHNISANTFYLWKSKFGGMNISEAQRLRQLEAENAKLKRIVADQALDIVALKDVVSKNW
jgi:putative transposase